MPGSMLASSGRASSRSSTKTPPRWASITAWVPHFAQTKHLDLRVGGIEPEAHAASELVLVVGGVGDVELDPVDGHHPQIAEPRAGGTRTGQRPGHPRVEF